MRPASPTAVLATTLAFCLTALAHTRPPPEELRPLAQHRTNRDAQDHETYLQREIVDGYPARAARSWHRDYSSVDAFLKSVEPNRRRWRDRLNPPVLTATGPLQGTPASFPKGENAQWLSLPLGPIAAEGLLVIPQRASGPVPLVIAQHGLASYPERGFGAMDDGDYYHSYGERLVQAGFAVLAPMNLRGVPNRNRIERLCRLADTTLPGIEFARMQRLLDEVLKDPRIDSDRVGMWGISLGGMATMFWMPLEPRIRVGVVTAWFNHRLTKMAVHSDKYVSFMDVDEEHAFLRGWCTEFADHDVASLICPRPLLVQHGKQDRIGWWPDILQEFETARTHYERLGLADRIAIDLWDGRHEINFDPGVAFLRRWLMDAPPAR